MPPRRLVVISDHCTEVPPRPVAHPATLTTRLPQIVPRDRVRVTGGYLERLPLASVAAGLVDLAEIWSFAGRCGESDASLGLAAGRPDPERPGLTRRLFRAEPGPAPYRSTEVVAHLRDTGAPEILCVWGLGVDHDILDAARGAVTIYNSIDAPALRIPDDLARRFALILTGAPWQSAQIAARLPDARVLELPVGPCFASELTFHPTGAPKDRDVVYVACAQPYKRHDILFDALERRPGTTALLVVGYGEDDLRAEIARRGLDVEVVGPPGVSHDAVNRLINRARVGVVCGEADGAPAILTEYQLAGLPVLANARLSCGLAHVPPEAGEIAEPGAPFAAALDRLLSGPPRDPRAAAIARCGWRASIARLASEITVIRAGRAGRYRHDLGGVRPATGDFDGAPADDAHADDAHAGVRRTGGGPFERPFESQAGGPSDDRPKETA